MATATPYGGLSKRPNSPGQGSPTLSQRGGGNARGRGPLPTPPSQQGAKGSTWTAAPTAWSRRGLAGSPSTTTSTSTSTTTTSSTSPSDAAITYPAYTYPSSGGAGLSSTPSKISALTAKFESSTSTRPTSPSPSYSSPSASSPSPSLPSSSSTPSPAPATPKPTPAPAPNPATSYRAGGGPTSVRSQLMNSGGGGGASRAAAAGKPSWKNLPPPPAAPTADEVVDAVPDAGSQPDHAVDAEPAQPQEVAVMVEQPQQQQEEEEEEVTCSLCDHVFVYPANTECPMCGEAYGAPADDAAQTRTEEGPRQVECSLCDHPYEYPTLRECPMCGEAYGAPADEPTTTSNAAAAAAAPGSITAMLMQLQQSVQAQQEEQQADNARLEQLRLEEERDKRPKSIEEESKRMVMCGHCGHTYEYPTYNFCDNCGHPSSNASLRLSQIKRQTWAQGGRQSMQIGAGAIEQMLASAAANGGSGGGGDGQELPGMVNFCPDCGTSTDGGSQRFCGMCGKSFRGDEPALPESDVPTSPMSSRHETGERDKIKKKNKSWGKKTSYRTYFTEVSSSPITSRVKKFSKRGRDDKSSRTIEVKSDWQHMAASLPSTPDAISAYKQMMIAKYEAQQKENVFIRSTSRRGSAEFRSLDVASMGAYRQDASEDGSLSPRGGYQQAPRSPRVGGGSPYAHTSTSFRAHASSPNLISSPSASYRIAVGHQEIDQQIGAVLAELNLAKYGTAFAQEEVTYEAFLLLEADDLTQMGIPIGPRKLILAKILELKQ